MSARCVSIAGQRLAAVSLVIGLLAACSTDAPSSGYADVPRYFNVPYVTTPPEVVTAMLELAGAGPGDIVYDLGSGDGRIPIADVHDFGATKFMTSEQPKPSA